MLNSPNPLILAGAARRVGAAAMGLLGLALVSGCTTAAPPAPTTPPTLASVPKPAVVSTAAPSAVPLAVASAPAVTTVPATAAPSGVDFKGKTIHIIVGYAPGGGFDATARIIAPLLGKALAGTPNVVVENQVGADSLLAAKTVLTGAPRSTDIDVVVYISTLLAKSQISNGLDGFAPEKASVFLGKPDASPTQLGLCANSQKIKSLDEFLALKQPLKTAALTGTSLYDTLLRWTVDVGLPISPVFGYAGTSQMALAFSSGEVDATPSCRDADLTANPDWLDKGFITPLFYWDAPADQITKLQAQGKFPWYKNVLDIKPGTPDQKAVLLSWLAINRGTNIYAVNKQTPGPVVDALRQAFKQVVTSIEYVSFMQTRQLQVGYMSPDEIVRDITALDSTSTAGKDLLKKMLAI